ncbi:chemotaxis protein CheA [Epibacterium ulvae]|uniref:chemotaxis protein CheA n=1 Tax=Epibacterium ulvae TaxID=1156985 RepID=UPI001BFCC9F9|nr:chemotaxis protein CheA [Epibacterium ulvae]MBT8152332.1 chemotaxis protein CheA [Epibacterium ulvae]
MVQNNKVLTVSYGTFSCTLEGFEDSFGTMKAIAEYFRDLASDDRYFGAEPPQPDADMLARIAQREIARQVEVRTSNEGIHLRAAVSAAPQAAPVAPAPVAEPATRELTETEPGEVDFFVDPAAAKEQAHSAPTVAAPQDDAVEAYSIEGSSEEPFADDFEDETVAEEIVAAAAPAAGQLVETPPGEVDFFVAPEAAQKIAEEADTQAEDAYSFEGSNEEPFADELEDEAIAEDVVAAAEPAAGELVETPPGEVDFFVAPEEAKEIAEDAEILADSSEDLVADDFEEAFEDDVAEVEAETDAIDLEQIAAVVAANKADETDEDIADEIEAEPVAEEAQAKPAPNSIAAKLQRIRAVVSRTPSDEFSEDQHADPVAEEASASVEAIAEDINASLNADDTDEDFDADETDAQGDDSDTLIARALEGLQETTQKVTKSAAAPAKEAAPEAEAEEAPAQPRRARVIRVRRGVTKPAETVAEAAPAPAGPPSTLSDADEDDLRRELAEVEAELLAATRADTDADADTAEAEAVETLAEAPAQSSAAPTGKDASDSDVSRLMAAADEKLDDPDTASSRETYSHMRAAVAAAQSDPEAAGDDVEKDYREDLASVVQPRRPVVRRKSPRPEAKENRPTPLKLVAEQRVSDPAEGQGEAAKPAATTAPVRPRRVRTEAKPTTAEAFNSDTGFAKYVQETGAVELQEMLEAAASYLSFVKGQDVFSRPELINKVRATGTEFNREDSMRSFGQLLRDGKIARKRNGRFSASEQIGFQPQGRAAG